MSIPSHLSDPLANFHNVWDGAGSLKTWEELPTILAKDNRYIKDLNVQGFGLVEAVCEALAADHKTYVGPMEMINAISQELTEHLEYTRYLKSPVTREGVQYDRMRMMDKDYGKAVCDLFLPAIASVYNLNIRVIKKVGKFFAIMHKVALDFVWKPNQPSIKSISLVYADLKYKPVILQPPQSIEISPIPPVQNQSPEVIIISDEEEDLKPLSPTTSLTFNIKQEIEQPQEFTTTNNIQDEEDSLPSIKMTPTTKTIFNMRPFIGMIPDVVNQVPHEIDGLKYYVKNVPEDDTMCMKYWNGRYFQMNTSKRKGFNGIRRIGKCRGNFMCKNPECGYLQDNNKANEVQFRALGKSKFCFVCDAQASRKPCGA